METVTVLGAGLAGSECAWQLARRGIRVRLWEMKPEKMSPAHHSPYFGELVCSNSLRSDELTNAVGLLKAEMRAMDSLIMASADANKVAAGGALAVDREGFARQITETLEQHPNVEIIRKEALDIPDGQVVIATGPSAATPLPKRSPPSARTATCIFTTPWPPSSPWTAWTWTAPSSPPATTREPRIM